MARSKHCQQRKHYLTQLNSPKVNFDFSNIKEPLYDAQDLNYIVSPDLKKTFDSRSVIARILDGSEFEEYKK